MEKWVKSGTPCSEGFLLFSCFQHFRENYFVDLTERSLKRGGGGFICSLLLFIYSPISDNNKHSGKSIPP